MVIYNSLRVFTLIFFLYSLNLVASEMYYIAANSSDCFAAVTCQTLHQIALNTANSNTTLVFLPGRRLLAVNLTFSNLDYFSVISWSLIEAAQIECTPATHIFFNHSQYIHITNIDFIGCGGNQVKNVDQFVLRDVSLLNSTLSSGAPLELIKTTAHIMNCTFTFNKISSATTTYRSIIDTGGVILSRKSKISVNQSKFENNRADYDGAILYAEQKSIISIKDSVFVKNGTLYGVLYCNNSNITIEASKFKDNIGGAITPYHSYTTLRDSAFENNVNRTLQFESSTVSIINSSIIFSNKVNEYNNLSVVSLDRCNVTIVASVFNKNNGTVLHFNISKVMIDNSKFENNRGVTTVISLFSQITIQGCNFMNNNPFVAVVIAFSSRVEHYGSLLLADNSAQSLTGDPGFVLLLVESDFIQNHSGNLTVLNNTKSVLGIKSSIIFFGHALFINNGHNRLSPQFATNVHNQGGAITLFHSKVFLMESAILSTTMLWMVEHYFLVRVNSM